jgi:Late exocytosis, associated with Golgi transport/Cytosolic domain of 10TM putative phosphate transporter
MSNDTYNTTNNNNVTQNARSSTSDDGTNSNIVVETLRIYGSFYLISLSLFCFYLQRRFPKYYNIRSWSTTTRTTESASATATATAATTPHGSQCDAGSTIANSHPTSDTTTPTNLAQTTYSYPTSMTWMIQVFDPIKYSDETLQDHCGMDTICFLRALRFGRILSIVGCCNAIYLIPLYYTSVPILKDRTTTSIDSAIVDPLSYITVSHLPSSSKRFIGTVFAAYITYLYTMYLIYLEYRWFTKMKHRFLSQSHSIRNYTVYVSGIPRVYRTSYQLANYFRQCSSSGSGSKHGGTSSSSVYEAHIALETPKLDQLIHRRDTIVQKLEHTVAYERKTGKSVSHRTISIPSRNSRCHPLRCRRRRCQQQKQQEEERLPTAIHRPFQKVESVQTFEEELVQLNRSITKAVQEIRHKSAASQLHQQQQQQHNDKTSTSRLSVRPSNNHHNSNRRTLIRNTASKDLLAAIRADLQSDGSDDDDDDDDDDNDDGGNNDDDDANDNDNDENYDLEDVETSEMVELIISNSRDPVDAHNNSISRVTFDIDDPLNTEQDDYATSCPATESKSKHFPEHDVVDAAFGIKDDDKNTDSDKEQMELSPSNSSGRFGSQTSLQTSIRLGMLSGSNAVRDSIGTLVSTSKVAGTTIVRSSIVAGTTLAKTSKYASSTILQTATDTGAETIRRAQSVGNNVLHSAGSVVPLLRNKTEGKVTDAGFVVFTSLYATQTVLQMIHHPKPYVFTFRVIRFSIHSNVIF